MQPVDFDEAIKRIVEADERYQPEAYIFVQEAICYTQKTLGRDKQKEKHVAGRELLDGIREFALSSYGPMAMDLLGEWGIRSCEDFGEIVFNLIEHQQASRSQTDSRDDFKDGYDFKEAFRKPFLPAKRRPSEPKPAPAKMIGHD